MNKKENINRLALCTRGAKVPTAPELYGLFFEDINHAADGGLYPEMLRNRTFEDSLVPEGCTADPGLKIYKNNGGWPGAFQHGEGMDEWAAAVPYTPVPAWYTENARMKVLTEGTLNRHRKAALSVEFGEGGSLANIGYCGISAKAGERVHFLAFLKTEEELVLRLTLEDKAGGVCGLAELAVPATAGFARVETDIPCTLTCHDLRFVMTSPQAAKIVLGFTSLMPEHTFKGHGLREDLALALKNTHARFIRFPGGCVVEGINEENTLKFSKTIGPVWERESAQLMWHYRTTNGLGFHEFLQLCEDLEMEAMYVCNCGMSCQARHGRGFSAEVTRQYLDEALHALSYALDSPETEYGQMRAAAGHPEPFRLKYVEIGNENFGDEYLERYELFYHTLKEAYPDVIYISNGHTEREGLPTEMVDEHYYNAPEFFLENTEMFGDYDRSGPQIFLGEYAVNGGSTIASMECALAEAAFLTGVEKNQDIVKLSAYAPLFQNRDYTAWKPNLIVFNNHEVYGIPSYHVLSLLGKYRGKQLVPLTLNGPSAPPRYRGIPGILCEEEGLLFRNVCLNSKAVTRLRTIYGELEAVPEEGAWRMVFGDTRHHYSGKDPVWNLAFEEFMNSGDFREVPIMWVMFDEDPGEACCVEFEAKFSASNAVTFSVFNSCPDTDAGCNEPRDAEWNRRRIRNQIWHIEEGRSSLRVPRLFEKPVPESEKMPVVIDYSRYHRYRIEANPYGYRCYIDGCLITEKKQPLHPLLYASCEKDGSRLYLKVVNVSGEEQALRIIADDEIRREMEVETVSARPDAANSFASPLAVSAKRQCITAAECGCAGAQRELELHVPAWSVNVYCMDTFLSTSSLNAQVLCKRYRKK